MRKINRKVALYAAIFLLGGCLNEQNMASETTGLTNKPTKVLSTQTCNIPVDAFKKLPAEVLDGTNVVNIDNFKPTNNTSLRFYSDIGGASIEIDSQLLNEQHKIQRSYKEPGLENSIKEYKNLCVKAGYLYGENVRGIFTKKGILWLELASDNEFISSDLWIFLTTN